MGEAETGGKSNDQGAFLATAATVQAATAEGWQLHKALSGQRG